MTTIKQLADELGVTKQAIHKQVSKLPPGMVSTGRNRSLLINEDGKAIIQAKVATKAANKTINLPTTEDYQSLKILQLEHEITLVKKERDLERKNHVDKQALYEQELKAKDKQLEDMQQTIQKTLETMEHAVTALNAAQALHAGTMHKQLVGASPEGEPAAVEITAEQLREEAALQPGAEPEQDRPRRSWWPFAKKK